MSVNFDYVNIGWHTGIERVERLKGCPICGKKPTIEFKWTEKDGLSANVVCKNCDLRLHVQDEDLTRAVDAVIEKWNNRAV